MENADAIVLGAVALVAVPIVTAAAIMGIYMMKVSDPDSPLYTGPASTYDSCKLDESQIRKFWVQASFWAKNEDDRTQIAQQLVSAAESLCRSDKAMFARPPVRLPADLH